MLLLRLDLTDHLAYLVIVRGSFCGFLVSSRRKFREHIIDQHAIFSIAHWSFFNIADPLSQRFLRWWAQIVLGPFLPVIIAVNMICTLMTPQNLSWLLDGSAGRSVLANSNLLFPFLPHFTHFHVPPQLILKSWINHPIITVFILYYNWPVWNENSFGWLLSEIGS